MKNNYLTKQQVQELITGLKVKESQADEFFKGLTAKGYTLEGYNDGSKGSINEPSTLQKIGGAIKNVATGIKEGVVNAANNINDINNQVYAKGSQEYQKYKAGEQSMGAGIAKSIGGSAQGTLQEAGQIANATVNTPIMEAVGGAFNIADAVAQGKISQAGQEILATPVGQEALQVLQGGMDKYNQWKIENPNKAKNIEAVINIASIVPAIQGVKDVALGTKAIAGATKDALGTVVNDTKSFINNAAENVSSKVGNIKKPNLFPIDATENIKTSLNPFLTNTKAKISVPTKDGYVLKTVDKITPEEKIAVQNETSNIYDSLAKRAEEFKTDRRDILSPLEIVGKRTDDLGLQKAEAIRKKAGATMGEIENLYKDTPVELSGNNLNTFINEYLGSNKKYGRTVKDKTFMEDFAKDFDKLSKNPTAKETLDFTRTWTNELEDLKDGFGQFKDNKRTYTVIEGALKDIKNNTRDVIGELNQDYKKALADYRITSQIRDEGNRLLGKEGLYGERIKGGALAKRAVQSSSDAGARQFLNKLKELTGYDGIKEADIAIQAMKDAGDYQGLSLLEVNKDLYNATVGKVVSKIPGGEAVSELFNYGANKIVPQSKRVNKLIKK